MTRTTGFFHIQVYTLYTWIHLYAKNTVGYIEANESNIKGSPTDTAPSKAKQDQAEKLSITHYCCFATDDNIVNQSCR